MTAPFWLCFPRVSIKHATRLIPHPHVRRVGRHIRRAAGAIVSKPAAVVWVCIATGGGWWSAGMPGWSAAPEAGQPYADTGLRSGPFGSGASGGGVSGSGVSGSGVLGSLAYFPPEFGEQPPEFVTLPSGVAEVGPEQIGNSVPSLAFFPVPDCCTPIGPSAPIVPQPQPFETQPSRPQQEQPLQPERPTKSIAEPNSIALLAMAFAVFAAWRAT